MKLKLVTLVYTIVIFSILLYSTSPSVNSGDSGEFITTSYVLGIAHSPGYPLYSFLCKILATVIPFGNYAYRVNVSNVIFTLLILLFTLLWAEKIYSYDKAKYFISMFTLSAIVFSVSYLRNTIQAEVFILNVLLVMFIIMSAFSLINYKKWYAISFILGIASGNHHTIVFLLPGLLYLYFACKFSVKKIVYLFVFFVLGFSINLVMPIRSTKQPYFDWGDTERLYNFYRVITRKDYGTFQLTVEKPLPYNFRNGLLQIKRFIDKSIEDLSLILFLVGIIGFYFLYVYNKKFFIFLFTSYVLSGIGFVILSNLPFEPIYDGILERFYILPNFILAYSVILSAVYINSQAKIILVVFLLMSTIGNLFKNFPVCNYRNYYLNYDYGINILHTLLPGSILFMDGGDDTFYTLGYLQAVEKRRQDVSLHDRGGLVFKNIYGEDFRTLTKEEKEKRRNYIEQSFINKRKVFYSTFNKNILPGYKLKYAGVLYAVDDGKLPAYFSIKFFREIYSYRSVYVQYHDYRSRALVPIYYFMEAVNEENIVDSFNTLRFALISWPEIDWLKNNALMHLHHIAYNVLLEKRNYKFCEEVYKFILYVNNKDITAWLNLGVVYEKLGMLKDAEMCYYNVINIDNNNISAYYNLGVIYWQQNNWDKVIECFNKVLQLQPENNLVRNYLYEAIKRKQSL